MQEKAGDQGAAYIPMPKGRGFTPHFDKNSLLDAIAALETTNFEVKFIKIGFTLAKKPVEPKPASSRGQNEKAGK